MLPTTPLLKVHGHDAKVLVSRDSTISTTFYFIKQFSVLLKMK